MHKFRCPWCGEESFTKMSSKEMEKKSRFSSKCRTICDVCGNFCGNYKSKLSNPYQKKYFHIMTTINILGKYFLWVPILFVLAIILKNPILLIIYSIIIIVVDFLYVIPNFYLIDLIRQDKEYSEIPFNKNFEIKVVFEENTKWTDKIFFRDGAILGVTYNTNIERYKRKIYPLVFENTTWDENLVTCEAGIIDCQQVPKELIFEGSEFNIIDNGKLIATGVIVKVLD